MHRSLPILGLGLALAFPAMAQSGPSIEDVRAMAFDKGVEDIKEIELDDGFWEVEGSDAGGREIEMKVNAATGEIVKMERR
jgi:uncharacterized membrane protein YkoI